MTKEQSSAIPEELYNLTQLAEVTLAAGRLSTTNVSEIKEYINSRKTPSERSQDQEQEQQNQMCSPAAAQCEVNSMKSANFTAFYSSSDEDSNYYSHKIFDRKKLRQSTISDNSRFDEHSSCSNSNLSIPCSSGDERMLEHMDFEGSKIHVSDSGGSTSGLLEDEHACPECGKKYSTTSNLARHRQTHRSIMDKKARRCPYCEKVYVSMPAFSMHVRTHNQGCECQYCGKCFSRPWLLQGHIRTHTGEKPFKCSVCNKAFADKSNLRAHVQTHSKTKPHSCSRCGKSFALKSYLYKHEESSCMKNHAKAEKETRSRRNSSCCSSPQGPVKSVSGSIADYDSAKFTLASKLLQKRAHPNMISALPYSGDHPLNLNSSRPAYARGVDVISLSAAVEVSLPTKQHLQEKSYTSVTNPMSQEEYECFKRISVIRPPLPLAVGVTYHDVLPTPMPMPVYSAAIAECHAPQEAPVDFSPKNNFSHSSKTSPFEMTGNYAIVA